MSKWPAVPLGSVVTILGGGTPSKSEKSFWNGPIPWASVRDLKDRWLNSTEFQISEQAIRASSAQMVPAGNVVICTRVGLGKVVQARFDLAINQDLKGLIPKEPTALDPSFLFYWYKSIAGRVIAMGTGATVQGVRLDDISNLLLPLPPLDEQKRIVAKLDQAHHQLQRLTNNLDLQETAISDLGRSTVQEQLRTAKRSASVSPSSGLDNFSPLEPLKDNWELVEIGSVCKVDWGNTKLTKKAYVEGGKYLAVSATGGDGRIDHAEHAANTPVLSAIGANCGRMFFPGEAFTAIKNTITLTPNHELISSDFLFHLMQSVQLPIRGAGQPFISKGDIQKFLISLPPPDEQTRIVERLAVVQRELGVFQEKLSDRKSLIARFRARVLSSALSGSTNVPQ